MTNEEAAAYLKRSAEELNDVMARVSMNEVWKAVIQQQIDAYSMAVDALLEKVGVADTDVGQNSEWISVKDRLPERTMPPHDVLVYHDLHCGMYIDRAWYSHENNKWRNVLGMNLKVTHWMPLPEKPKEDHHDSD